jgi:hypothetical protein
MTRNELFEWAKENEKNYPILGQISETVIDDITFIELPVKYGTYKGLYFCDHINPVVIELRQNGYAVGVNADYEIIQSYILECVKRHGKI